MEGMEPMGPMGQGTMGHGLLVWWVLWVLKKVGKVVERVCLCVLLCRVFLFLIKNPAVVIFNALCLIQISNLFIHPHLKYNLSLLFQRQLKKMPKLHCLHLHLKSD